MRHEPLPITHWTKHYGVPAHDPEGECLTHCPGCLHWGLTPRSALTMHYALGLTLAEMVEDLCVVADLVPGLTPYSSFPVGDTNWYARALPASFWDVMTLQHAVDFASAAQRLIERLERGEVIVARSTGEELVIRWVFLEMPRIWGEMFPDDGGVLWPQALLPDHGELGYLEQLRGTCVEDFVVDQLYGPDAPPIDRVGDQLMFLSIFDPFVHYEDLGALGEPPARQHPFTDCLPSHY